MPVVCQAEGSFEVPLHWHMAVVKSISLLLVCESLVVHVESHIFSKLIQEFSSREPECIIENFNALTGPRRVVFSTYTRCREKREKVSPESLFSPWR